MFWGGGEHNQRLAGSEGKRAHLFAASKELDGMQRWRQPRGGDENRRR